MGVSPSPSPAPLVCLLLPPPGPPTGPNSSVATSAGVAGAGKVVCLLPAQHSDLRLRLWQEPKPSARPTPVSAPEASGLYLSLAQRLEPMGTGHCREAGEKLRRPGLHKPDRGISWQLPQVRGVGLSGPMLPKSRGPETGSRPDSRSEG